MGVVSKQARAMWCNMHKLLLTPSQKCRQLKGKCFILRVFQFKTSRAPFCNPDEDTPVKSNTWSALCAGLGAAEMSPGVSMMVRLGQYLYSTRTTISRSENLRGSDSRRRFSLSMNACRVQRIEGDLDQGIEFGQWQQSLKRVLLSCTCWCLRSYLSLSGSIRKDKA